MSVIGVLKSRGLIDSATSEELSSICCKPVKLYIGFDPTADSLHLGHLLAIVVLRWFQKFGHIPYIVMGGATGRIGDPSGKSKERVLLEEEKIEENLRRIYFQWSYLLDHSDEKTVPRIANNNEWLSNYPLIDFLRDVGKYFRVNTMLTKESVKNRIASEEGISFTEFSYQLLQAYDFFHLFSKEEVILQAGGTDQWGNITAGIDLIRRLMGKTAYGFTYPLLTRGDGKKFGKTEEGTVWLASDRSSPYDLYQYLYRTADKEVIRLMRMLTFMELSEIQKIEEEMNDFDSLPNQPQKRLAEEVTRLVHGEEGLKRALHATRIAAPGSDVDLSTTLSEEFVGDIPRCGLKYSDLIGSKLINLVVTTGLLPSRSAAVRLIAQGGIYLNNQRINDPQRVLAETDLNCQSFLLLGIGKKKRLFIEIV